MVDTYEKQYRIPEDIVVSSSRPDIFLYSRQLKRVIPVELTVPWEINIPKDHTFKVNKYYDLTRNRYIVNLYAVEVGARVTKYKNVKVEQPKPAIPNVVSANPLDNLDFSNPAFIAGVDRVCALTGVGSHPDPKFRLSAITKIIKTAPHPYHPKGEINIVQQPSDVLKLLFIQHLRGLQTKINEALVAVQTVTADPRTDTKLGQVGR